MRFPPLETETSSHFWLDTSVDIALTGQLYDKSISTGLFLAKNFVLRFFIFAYRGHLQVLKVCDLKLSCPSQLCGLRTGKSKSDFKMTNTIGEAEIKILIVCRQPTDPKKSTRLKRFHCRF